MNRKEAQNHIGKLVLIDEYANGRYIAELTEVITEPKKPWRGKVKILAVDTYPVHVTDKDGNTELPNPLYSFEDFAEIQSAKIEPLTEEHIVSNYEDSIFEALQAQIEKLQLEKSHLNSLQVLLNERLAELKPTSEIIENNHEKVNKDDDGVANKYIFYTVKKENDQLILFDEKSGQHLTTEGCPFEFELKVNKKWVQGYCVADQKFEAKDGSVYPLREAHVLRLHKKQFDPYHILINELEKPALQALQKGLSSLGVTHEQCVQCHNTLLIQLLNTNQQTTFKGVNFITYHGGGQVILVQHHYEREIIEDSNDITFDRFEFTSDKGKRTITTYSNEFTKGK